MTKTQTISRERLEEIASFHKSMALPPSHDEIEAMASMLLAGMDSEPVDEFISLITRLAHSLKKANPDSELPAKAMDYLQRIGFKQSPLRTIAPPAPVMRPMMFIDGDISSDDAEKLAKVIRDFNEEDERPLAKMARIIRDNPHPTNQCDMPKAQPSPVAVPDELIAELLVIAKNAADEADECGRVEHNDDSDQHTKAIADWERRAAMQAESVTAATVPPHIYRELVNQLRDTAVKYQGCQQLREQLSTTLRAVITPAAPEQEV